MQLNEVAHGPGIGRRRGRRAPLTSRKVVHKSIARRIGRNFNLVSDHPLDFSEYLPYLINRVGWLLVIDFGQNTLARHRLSIAMWRVLAVLANNGGQRQVHVAPRTRNKASTLSAAA